jgi:Fur family zinc uptake transcriptional regulator
MTDPAPNVFERHDHRRCRKTGLTEARTRCAETGLRLTPVRERVLEILLESHRALGAYDILDRLKAEGFGGQPPVVYRALDFLVENGFAHRLERLNAFTACLHAHEGHQPLFLVCEACRSVAETPLGPVAGALESEARALGFSMTGSVVEVIGLCPACHEAAA